MRVLAVLAANFLLVGCSAHRISPVGEAAQPDAISSSVAISVSKINAQPEGYQCFEPLLYVLTLGIVPTRCVDTFKVSVASEESELTATRTYEVTTVHGWFSFLLAPTSPWRYGEIRAPENEIERFVRTTGK